MTNEKIILGKSAEDLAADFLKRQGYRIVERNVRLGFGEIDLVAWDADTLCFVEVRARTTIELGHPLESVTYRKQRKLSKLALAYLKKRYQDIDRKARFDVVGIVPNEQGGTSVEVVKNAFDFCG